MTEFSIINILLSQSVLVEGHRSDIQIYRGEDTMWTLEVVNEKSTSFVWDELCPTDRDALGAALADFENSPVEEFLE